MNYFVLSCTFYPTCLYNSWRVGNNISCGLVTIPIPHIAAAQYKFIHIFNLTLFSILAVNLFFFHLNIREKLEWRQSFSLLILVIRALGGSSVLIMWLQLKNHSFLMVHYTNCMETESGHEGEKPLMCSAWKTKFINY